MATLEKVGDYVSGARRLLQDQEAPYRWTDQEMIEALNFGLLESRRLRPDLFIGRLDAVPSYENTSETVVFDPQFRTALLYYVAGHVGLPDVESAQDAKAAEYKNKFVAQLLTITS